MAALQERNGSWRVIFWYGKRQHAFTIGEVDAADAAVYKASTEELVRLLKRNMVTLPTGCPIEQFMFFRGKPPGNAEPDAAKPATLTLTQLRKAYVSSQTNKLEDTTLAGIRLHFDHLTRILKEERLIPTLSRGDLQGYVNKRSEEWIDPNVYRRKRRKKHAARPARKNRKAPPPESEDKPLRHPSAATIKKEIISLRTAWNWARRHLDVVEEFPGNGLDYAKTEEELPFMTWEEAERRIKAGDNPDKVWDCVYLRPEQVSELLEWVKARPLSPWVYPMLVFAAHTGARRSEIVRAVPSDVDLLAEVITLKEKKRVKKKLSTRRVPMSPLLKDVLWNWMKTRAKGANLFCKGDGQPISPREAMNYFQRALRVSKWKVLRGLHVFRHSLISTLASKGVDQRVIDDIAGHSTDEQRRRYRHLFPHVTKNAIKLAFE
jgi:integrase